jgi:hydrogenase nickel incorporation protein HypA/HybF
MHEVSIVESLLKIAAREIESHPDARVRSLRVRVGRMRQVIPETMRFCYEVAAAGTRFEGSRLEITAVPVRARCRRCGLTFDVEEMMFLCPECAVADVETLTGNELLLESIELDESSG